MIVPPSTAASRANKENGPAGERDHILKQLLDLFVATVIAFIHPMVIAFPIAFFVLAFVSDITFYATSNQFWATASFWLLSIGLITAAVAAVTGLIECSATTGFATIGYAGACGEQCRRVADHAL